MPVALIPSMHPNIAKRRANTLRSFCQGDYTHATTDSLGGKGMIMVYALETCDVCGCTLQAANAVHVAGTLEIATLAGLTVEAHAPEEGGWSDLHGGVTCGACNTTPRV